MEAFRYILYHNLVSKFRKGKISLIPYALAAIVRYQSEQYNLRLSN